MKSKEFHRWIMKQKSKWKCEKAEGKGSHYIYVHEDGRRYPVPFHGSREIGEGLRRRIINDMGL